MRTWLRYRTRPEQNSRELGEDLTAVWSRGAAGCAPTHVQVVVRILGPLSVTATVCSKCADSDPSWVTTVHLSSSVRIAEPPILIIGSIAIVMPGARRGPRFGLP